MLNIRYINYSRFVFLFVSPKIIIMGKNNKGLEKSDFEVLLNPLTIYYMRTSLVFNANHKILVFQDFSFPKSSDYPPMRGGPDSPLPKRIIRKVDLEINLSLHFQAFLPLLSVSLALVLDF